MLLPLWALFIVSKLLKVRLDQSVPVKFIVTRNVFPRVEMHSYTPHTTRMWVVQGDATPHPLFWEKQGNAIGNAP